jgi:hypothetical protein
MLPEEARWLGQRLAGLSSTAIEPLINVGSSTGKFVTEEQPWIDAHLLAPVRTRGLSVINIDMKAAAGVDLVGDVCDAAFRARVAAVGCRALMCTNLLEHVRNPAEIATALTALIPKDGYLFISGPKSYPWHADPIDTLFRPDVDGLARLFEGTELVAGAVVESGTYWDWLARSRFGILRALVRLLLPFYFPRGWWSAVLKVGWLFRPFSATCVILRKR